MVAVQVRLAGVNVDPGVTANVSESLVPDTVCTLTTPVAAPDGTTVRIAVMSSTRDLMLSFLSTLRQPVTDKG